MSSAGVVFALLLRGTILVEGKNETEQLNKIYELVGSIVEPNWPGVSTLPKYDRLKPETKMESHFKEIFKDDDKYVVQLLEGMLTLDPSKRISAKDALQHVCFSSNPLPSDPKSIPEFECSLSLFVERRIKEEKRKCEETSTEQCMPSPSKRRRTS